MLNKSPFQDGFFKNVTPKCLPKIEQAGNDKKSNTVDSVFCLLFHPDVFSFPTPNPAPTIALH